MRDSIEGCLSELKLVPVSTANRFYIRVLCHYKGRIIIVHDSPSHELYNPIIEIIVSFKSLEIT